jgi:Domain of unknown function (DUF4465)/Secretion system C-terminal sorting domain
MKNFLIITTIVTASVARSQDYSEGFEAPVLALDTSWYGQDQMTDGDTIYSNGFLDFELNFNAGFNSFTGFSVSSMTDTMTTGSANQFSAITGVGSANSDQYSICFAPTWANNRVFLQNPADNFYSVKVTNTTYAYKSMLNGDMFGKPFGADTSATGAIDNTNGEDWFLLTIYALGSDSLNTGDSINFYLADYTFANDSLDYLIDSWQTIDLIPLYSGTEIYGLDFVLTSSDTAGGFGMNTPSYFALDDLEIVFPLGIDEIETPQIAAYPNPTNGELIIETNPGSILELYDLNGNLVLNATSTSSQFSWNLADLTVGIYYLVSIFEGEILQTKIIKQ